MACSVVLYSTMSPSRDDGAAPYLSAEERRIWVYSAGIVLLCEFLNSSRFYLNSRDDSAATAAQHLTSTAISAGFLKLCHPSWLLPHARKLEGLLKRRSKCGKGDRGLGGSGDASEVKASKRIIDDDEADGRGSYFT